MKRISRILAVGFTVASLGVVISGCGGGDQTGGDASESGQNGASTSNDSAANASVSAEPDNLMDTAARLASESLDGAPVTIGDSEEPEVEDSGAIPVDEGFEAQVDDPGAEVSVSEGDERISVGGAAEDKSRAQELLERAESYAQENKDYKVVTTLRKVDESELDASQLRKKNSMYEKASKALANTEKGLVVE